LINIILQQRGMPLSGGCSGYGCGAAFNFLVVLPDGEVHACRKFPSLIGNIFQQSFSEIYESTIARQYRSGSAACRQCELHPVCGGCLAITRSRGLDIFTDGDPMCFKERKLY
jgi:radical SAM protein with 4Fe4S-binding SPASM domain